MTDPIRIANCSGFFGDRPSAAREMVEGGPIDVLTGDWLAELTMLILSRIQAKRPGQGYARTFVKQMEDVMGTCLDHGIKVVSNAGGLDPDGCAEAVAEVAATLGLNPTIAYVNGDNLVDRAEELSSTGDLRGFDGAPLDDVSGLISANAYLGCFGIVDALARGADIVITGRVTDAAVVCGPAAWHHGWARDDFDQLAGGVVAGHIIECGAQATGGNYSFFTEIDGRTNVGGLARFGFPWADVASDGSSVIGKHDGTGGAVTVGTVTSQLLYEIAGPEYLGPDVTARFDSIRLEQSAPDRVQISAVRGEAPPRTLKVAMNELGGYRNSISLALTGLDIEEKAEFAKAAFWDACPYAPQDFAAVDDRIIRTEHDDATTQEAATAVWRLTVKDPDEQKVGRAFSDAFVQTALSGIPGMYWIGGGPNPASPYGVYRPGLVPSEFVPSYTHILGAQTAQIDSVAPAGQPADVYDIPTPAPPAGPTRELPLGTLIGARSGDKGGNANIGLFARSEPAWAWLDALMTTESLRALLPECDDLRVDRFRFPKLWSLNFVIHGLLQEGVAASTRQDPQAKAVGEWLRSRIVPIPESLLVDSS